MLRSACVLALLTVGLVHPAQAQRPRAPTAGDAFQVRMELAAVLLQSRRYAEAAREYRAILATRPGSYPARLGLAQALAWSKQHRAAENELRVLRAQHPGRREVAALLRSVRQSLEPGVREAAGWFADDPGHPAYRRALARALVREGRAREAVPHYERLISFDASPALMTEAAQAMLEARQHDKAAAVLDRALQRAPSNAELLLIRAQLNLARRDLVAAEADALASLKSAPSSRGYVLLGDLRRWRADYDHARAAYAYARRLGPTTAGVRAASARLQRDERPILAFIPTDDRAGGWHLRSGTVNDNAGVAYTTMGVRRELELRPGSSASVEVELRRMREQSALIDAQVSGAAWAVGVAHELVTGPWLVVLQGRGGFAHHFESSIPVVGVSVASWYGPWAFSLEVAHRPAYPTLLTTAAIAAPDETPLRESTFTAATGGPIGIVDFAVSAQRAALSDDNQRTTFQVATRVPLTRNSSLIGALSGMRFDEASDRYWAPESYVAGAAGFELTTGKPLGFNIGVRALAGPAHSIEEVVTERLTRVGRRQVLTRVVEKEEHAALQYSAGLDLGYRGAARGVGLTLGYSTGRAGGYSRFEASVYATLLR